LPDLNWPLASHADFGANPWRAQETHDFCGVKKTVIRLGIVGTNYGRTVQLPAFRADPRCEVIALAGSNQARTSERARAADVRQAYGDWRALVEDKDVDAVAIATPPALQAQIAIAALTLNKPVFAEKPMASTLDDARAMLRAAQASRRPTMIDFNFHQIMSWQRAKSLLDSGAIGALRHVAVHWHLENRAIQMRMRNWKTTYDDGGGVLGNFISHCFHYLEWFCGPIVRLNARLSGLPGNDDLQTTVAMALEFQAGQLASLSMSCASFLGSGHRIEFYGEDGTLVLANTSADYMRGFELWHAKRPEAALARDAIEDPADAQYPDGRIAPVSRLAKLFIDAIESGGGAQPDFAAGFRVQQLIDAAQRSHQQGALNDVASVKAAEEKRA
jgi:predicted dehydrogenase